MSIAVKRRRRWGDINRRFGPFTYSPDGTYRPFAVVLSSGGGDEDEGGCNLRLSAFGRTLIIELPAIVKPHRRKVQARFWKPEDIERMGRDWYWEIDAREFGFSCSDGFLQVFRGRRTMASETDRTKGYFLPWKSWRHVRHSFYGLNGEHVATIPDTGKSYLGDPGRFERERAISDATPTILFEFNDFDGERITVTTKIEEREWKRGEGRFKWLSWFTAPKIIRSLDLRFSSEVGRRKGSWKGGTVGHSIEMLPGELHEAAFIRYCDRNNMTFVGRAALSEERAGE